MLQFLCLNLTDRPTVIRQQHLKYMMRQTLYIKIDNVCSWTKSARPVVVGSRISHVPTFNAV